MSLGGGTKQTVFDSRNPDLEKKGVLLKLDRSRDMTGMVDNIHSNFSHLLHCGGEA